MADNSSRNTIPFEPGNKKKNKQKKNPETVKKSVKNSQKKQKSSDDASLSAIPDSVRE